MQQLVMQVFNVCTLHNVFPSGSKSYPSQLELRRRRFEFITSSKMGARWRTSTFLFLLLHIAHTVKQSVISTEITGKKEVWRAKLANLQEMQTCCNNCSPVSDFNMQNFHCMIQILLQPLQTSEKVIELHIHTSLTDKILPWMLCSHMVCVNLKQSPSQPTGVEFGWQLLLLQQ